MRIRELTDLADLVAVAALFDAIWQSPGGEVPLHLLRAVSHTGGMVLGAYHDDTLIGGAFGFRCATGEPALHSHIVGVDPAWHRHGIGTRIKRYQRQWCLDRGIPVITWTFDPLVRRNAVFNIARLGAAGTAYLPDFYGAMEDVYNAGLPSDRMLVTWRLDDQPRPVVPDAVPVLDVDETGAPRRLSESDAPVIRLRVPADQPRAPESRLAWLTALRDVLAPRMAGGHQLTSVTDDGWYVLTPSKEVR